MHPADLIGAGLGTLFDPVMWVAYGAAFVIALTSHRHAVLFGMLPVLFVAGVALLFMRQTQPETMFAARLILGFVASSAGYYCHRWWFARSTS